MGRDPKHAPLPDQGALNEAGVPRNSSLKSFYLLEVSVMSRGGAFPHSVQGLVVRAGGNTMSHLDLPGPGLRAWRSWPKSLRAILTLPHVSVQRSRMPCIVGSAQLQESRSYTCSAFEGGVTRGFSSASPICSPYTWRCESAHRNGRGKKQNQGGEQFHGRSWPRVASGIDLRVQIRRGSLHCCDGRFRHRQGLSGREDRLSPGSREYPALSQHQAMPDRGYSPGAPRGETALSPVHSKAVGPRRRPVKTA